MAEPIEQSPEAELATLRRVNSELTQKSATRKARISELEANVAGITAKATQAEARIIELTISGPFDELCQEISVAPQALRSAIESEYKIEMRDGVLTLLNLSDGKQASMPDGKAVPFKADAIKSLLLASKDDGKLKLYNAILVASKASGSAGSSSNRVSAKAPRIQFGLGIRHNQSK